MMKLLFLLLSAFAGSALADAPKADPTPAPFILPPSPAPPQPQPMPPNTPVNLVAGHPYVVRLNAANVVASPAGIVKLCIKPEPVVLIDSDGNDTTYTGDKSVCIVSALKQGAAELIIVGTTDGAELARVQIVVGNPPPGPGPGPTDPLTATFQAAYAADTDATKPALLAAAKSVFSVAATSLDTQPNVKTTADLAAWLGNALKALAPSKASPKLEAAVAAELQSSLGAPGTVALDLTKTKAELNRISSALDGVKP